LEDKKKIRCLWQNYYFDTKGIIFVIDSGDIQRIDNDCNEYAYNFSNPHIQHQPPLFYTTGNNNNNNNNNNHNNTRSHSNISNNSYSNFNNNNNLHSPSHSNSSNYYYNQHCARDELKQMLNHPSLNECPILIFANKQDLPNAMSIEEIKERLELNTITNRKWHVQPTCAITGEGINEGLTWLSKNIDHHHHSKNNKIHKKK